MGIGALNSSFQRRGYTSDTMEGVWCEEALIRSVFQVEAALAESQAELGVIPRSSARAIAVSAMVDDQVISQIGKSGLGNPLVAVLDVLREQVPASARGWIHFGATTQDILDTARALQISSALDITLERLEAGLAQVGQLAREHASTVMVARTNGQHALPTTLGMRFARWHAELERSVERIAQMRSRVQLLQFSGAAGTYASMGELGPTVAKKMAETLGLTFELVPWHASADVMGELASTMAIYGQTLAKIAEDLFAMQQTDFGEAHEPMDAHVSGSSAMPQKLNPFTTMKIQVGARMAAGMAATILTQPPATFERDHRQSEIQRDLIPQIFVAVDGAALKLFELLARICFDTEALKTNVNHEGVLLMSEAVMIALAPHLGQEKAHDVLQVFAARHREEQLTLEEFVQEDPRLTEALKGTCIADLSQPQRYVGLSTVIAENRGLSS